MSPVPSDTVAPADDSPLIRVYIVRHGETDENRLGIIQGQLDTKLNATGIKQARQVAIALKDIPFTLAFSSDLERAVKVRDLDMRGRRCPVLF